MSTRGTNFLHQWLGAHVPETIGADVISVNQLTNKLVADSKAAGLARGDTEEDTENLYQTILDVIVHFEPGLPE